MQKLSRQVFIEVAWLSVSLGFTLLLALLLLGRNFLSDTIDVHLHDTYFVIAPFHVLSAAFFLVTFIIYFVKEFRNSFRRIIANWILIMIGLTLVIALTYLIETFSHIFTVGWTSYPPLSALPETDSGLSPDPVARFIIYFLTAIQILVLTMLLIAAFRWGKQKGSEKNTTHLLKSI